MLAYCGLECDTCPIFLATIEKDRLKQIDMRKSISRDINRLYNMQLQPEDVTDCDGCKSNSGRLFSGCFTCKIRKCAKEKHFESCASCPDFACSVLEEFYLLDPSAKSRLETLVQLRTDQ